MTAAQLVKAYGRGATVRDLADRLGVSFSAVHRELVAANYQPRNTGRRYGVRQKSTLEMEKLARTLRAEGLRWADVAWHLGVTQGYAWTLGNRSRKNKNRN